MMKQRDKQHAQPDQNASQWQGRNLDKSAAGNKPASRGDQGLVGQDTDHDGKVVKPGQKPGLSHGTGHIDK